MHRCATLKRGSVSLSCLAILGALALPVQTYGAAPLAEPGVAWLDYIQETGNYYTFYGVVNGENLDGVTVTLGGLDAFESINPVLVNSDGTFTVTVQLQPGDSGVASAEVTDSGPFASSAMIRVILY